MNSFSSYSLKINFSNLEINFFFSRIFSMNLLIQKIKTYYYHT